MSRKVFSLAATFWRRSPRKVASDQSLLIIGKRERVERARDLITRLLIFCVAPAYGFLGGQRPLARFAFKPSKKIRDRQRPQVAFAALTDGDGLRRLFLVADHQHIRDLFELRLADLGADLVGTIVAADAEPLGGKLRFDRFRIIDELVAHGEDT